MKVDQVLQGHGTTNTGNLARRCFENPEKFASVLEIDPQLVYNISTILLAFKCKQQLILDDLEKFSWKTYCRYYELYPWSRMNPSLHKLLKHGCEICKEFPLPMAYFAEDASEAWHKLYRKNFISHARQNGRENRIVDVFLRAVYTTDPKISLFYIEDRLKTNKIKKLAAQIKQFIVKG